MANRFVIVAPGVALPPVSLCRAGWRRGRVTRLYNIAAGYALAG
jgi:hypothetical protein